jgi:hypothetical protein
MKKIVLLGVLFFCLFASPANAQFFLEEGKVDLSVSPGERVTKTLMIDNTSGESVSVRVYWEDFQYQAPYDGTKVFLPGGMGERSAAQWVNFTPRDFTIPPYGKQEIRYTITVPLQAKGGYYGVLFFEKQGASLSSGMGLDIVVRVGCLFFIETNDSSRKAAIEGIQLSADTLSGSFINQGDVMLIPMVTYYIMDEGGMVADRGEVGKLYLPSGATGSWQFKVPQSLNTGRYSLVINSDLGGGNVAVKEIEFAKDASGRLMIEGTRD